MNDPDVWKAFESTPAPIEPVANRDNSLQGFQRRLLEQCGEDLGAAMQLLERAYDYLYRIKYNPNAPTGLLDLLVDIADMKEKHHGKNR